MTEPTDAKRYNRIKLQLSICRMGLSLVFLLLCVTTPLSRLFADMATTVTLQPYWHYLLFVLITGVAFTLIELPLDFFGGYVLEHRYGLSNQSIWRWVGETSKGWAVGGLLMVPVACLLLYVLRHYPDDWWLLFAGALFVFSLLLGVIAPKLLLPLFYKLQPLESGTLQETLQGMAEQAKLSITGVFVIDMSKNTKKANAAFTGLGRSKRVLLGDTLVEEFTEDEIAAVFAHEVGHYRLRHIPKRLLLSGVSTFAAMAVAAWGYQMLVTSLGFSGVADPAATPLLLLILSLYGMVTILPNNAYSRAQERQADTYALQALGRAEPFISGMKKLQTMNLADPEPHPWVERLFHSHPSVGRRIQFARDFTFD